MIRKEPTLNDLVTSEDKATRQIDIKCQHVRRRQTTAEGSRTGQPHHIVPAVGRTVVVRIKSEQLKVEIQTARRNHLRGRQDAGTISCLHQTRSTDRADRARSAQLSARSHSNRPCCIQRSVHHQLARIDRCGATEGTLTIQSGRSGSLLGKAARSLNHPIKLRIHCTPNRQISVPQLDGPSNPVHRSKLLTLPIQIKNGPSRLNHRAC